MRICLAGTLLQRALHLLHGQEKFKWKREREIANQSKSKADQGSKVERVHLVRHIWSSRTNDQVFQAPCLSPILFSPLASSLHHLTLDLP